MVVGVPSGPVRIPLQLLQDRELRPQGTAMYVRSDVLRAMDLVAGVPLDELVTAELPLEHAARTFEATGSGGNTSRSTWSSPTTDRSRGGVRCPRR